MLMATQLDYILTFSINNGPLKKTIFRKGTDYITKDQPEFHYPFFFLRPGREACGILVP